MGYMDLALGGQSEAEMWILELALEWWLESQEGIPVRGVRREQAAWGCTQNSSSKEQAEDEALTWEGQKIWV